MRNYGSDRQRPGLAEFNQANTGLLHSSLFLYWVVLILVWTAASCLGASAAMAFVVTMAAFVYASFSAYRMLVVAQKT